CAMFLTLFLLFMRFLPMFALSELKAVTPQANPHGHGGDHGDRHGQGHAGHGESHTDKPAKEGH
ncbi:MAG: hypothetical protein KDA05_07175, partial [Phycisphaerales bacterium]|nr:hypothetical protein [Phycisphaerales bacterium]